MPQDPDHMIDNLTKDAATYGWSKEFTALNAAKIAARYAARNASGLKPGDKVIIRKETGHWQDSSVFAVTGHIEFEAVLGDGCFADSFRCYRDNVEIDPVAAKIDPATQYGISRKVE